MVNIPSTYAKAKVDIGEKPLEYEIVKPIHEKFLGLCTELESLNYKELMNSQKLEVPDEIRETYKKIAISIGKGIIDLCEAGCLILYDPSLMKKFQSEKEFIAEVEGFREEAVNLQNALLLKIPTINKTIGYLEKEISNYKSKMASRI